MNRQFRTKLSSSRKRQRPTRRNASRAWLPLLLAFLLAGCEAIGTGPAPDQAAPDRRLNPQLVERGKEIFRFDTFGDEAFWTDTARMHEVIQSSVPPELALQVGLKVDADALPRPLKDAIAAGQVDLSDPATTVALLKLDAVVGLQGSVEAVDGRDTLVQVGITCALCHSTVDDSFAPGVGKRLDGWANHDLDVGKIVALSPAIPPSLKQIMRAWGPGKYDPRINIDGKNTPIVIPPAYGLHGVELETYTGDGPVSYWNAYVAVTQMHGQGNFHDPRLGIHVTKAPDLVTPKLPALREYQLSLAAPSPPPGSFDAMAARRGEAVFNGSGRCSTCHLPDQKFTDVNLGRLHAPSETGMDPSYAERTVTKRYRTTPLRGLAQRTLYFHDGSAGTLREVVEHYDRVLRLGLSEAEKHDLAQYLRTL